MTRQGKGSFVSEAADLAVNLRHQELDEHLSAAAAIGRQIGLTPEELESRFRAALNGKGTDEP